MGNIVEDAQLDRLVAIHAAGKTFDSWPEWETIEGKGSPRLKYRVALKLDGVLGGGAFVHLSTPLAVWDEDVYGQIEVLQPNGRSCWRLDPIEWKPASPHRNPNQGPSDLRLLTLGDRIHHFRHNRKLGLTAFAQKSIGIAEPFPRAINTFAEYCDLCAEVWNCPDMRDVPPPTWSKQLL